MTCPLARQFARWARESVQSAADQWLRARVVRIETFGTYACRTRNSRPGARLSEHGFANAVDVSGFVLADGRRITVEAGWRGEDERVRRFLRAVHQALPPPSHRICPMPPPSLHTCICMGAGLIVDEDGDSHFHA